MTPRAVVHEEVGRLLVATRSGRGGALVIEGEPGIGKSTFLDVIGTSADGFTVHRLGGSEVESAIDHLVLHPLGRELRRHLDALPPRQRTALESVLGWGEPDRGAERQLVGPATLSLLAAAADSGPVLVLVDDLHWMDVSSVDALLFVARRLASDPIALVLATRPVADRRRLAGLPLVVLDPLTDQESASALPPGTAPAVAARLAAATGGNPLALREAARLLSPAQLSGVAMLPDPLPIGARLDAIYQPQLERLSPAGRYALLLLAASRSPSADPIVSAIERRFGETDALEEVEDAGLVERNVAELHFCHPLIRSAVWSVARQSERREIHAALAACMSDEGERGRAWHLAEAATAPNDDLAAALERIASADQGRLGYSSASVSLERAADLSRDPRQGAGRMAAAIESAALAGDVGRARRLADALVGVDVDDDATGRALAVLGTIEHAHGSVPRASQLLRQAAERASGATLVRVLAELALAYHRLGDYEELFATGRHLVAAADSTEPEQRFLSRCFEGLIALVAGDTASAQLMLDEAFEIFRTERVVRDEPRHLPLATLTFGVIELTPERTRFLEERLEHARAVGAFGVLVSVLALFSQGRAFLLGDHLGAYADAGEAADLGTMLGIVADTAPALEALAWQSAARGDHDQAEELLERAADLVDRAGTASVAAHLALTRAFCAICRADHDEVIAILEQRLAVDGGRGGMGELLGVAPMLVEAYTATGRTTEARALADDFAAVAIQDAIGASTAERLLALSASDDEVAVEHYERALQAHVRSPDLFERARTELLYGAFLRRIGRRTDARTHLRAAHQRFEAMDHSLWADRCVVELAGSGESARRRESLGYEPLTPQETRVALLVAEGKTNRDVAAALFISPKTVESHLARVYRKRNLRSRTELARVVASGQFEADAGQDVAER